MLGEFHFIRPIWLFALLPLLVVIWHLWYQEPLSKAWHKICDEHLLSHLMQGKGYTRRKQGLALLLLCGFFFVISLAGPTWSRYPVPTYHAIQPRVLVLDMTEAMHRADLPPNRLSRAKFKLHDLLVRNDVGQIGLVVYSGEPFVVSPLTDDGNTIDALLETLTPEIMPVLGNRLDSALEQAAQLIGQAGFSQGDILVMTPHAPSDLAIDMANRLAQRSMHISVMPLLGHGVAINSSFSAMAKAGSGRVIEFSDRSMDIERWLSVASIQKQVSTVWQDEIPVWRDEGRWFLIPALIFLLPLFRRGWLQRLEA